MHNVDITIHEEPSMVNVPSFLWERDASAKETSSAKLFSAMDVAGLLTEARRQGKEAWMRWKAGLLGNVSLTDGIIEYAQTHEDLKDAFITFQEDADQTYPGWREKLGVR